MRKWLTRLLILLPALVLYLLSCVFCSIENTHYGFPNPGIDVDAVTSAMILSILAFVASSTALIIRHKDRVDFILPYALNALIILRISQIVVVYQKYEFLRMDGLVR